MAFTMQVGQWNPTCPVFISILWPPWPNLEVFPIRESSDCLVCSIINRFSKMGHLLPYDESSLLTGVLWPASLVKVTYSLGVETAFPESSCRTQSSSLKTYYVLPCALEAADIRHTFRAHIFACLCNITITTLDNHLYLNGGVVEPKRWLSKGPREHQGSEGLSIFMPVRIPVWTHQC